MEHIVFEESGPYSRYVIGYDPCVNKDVRVHTIFHTGITIQDSKQVCRFIKPKYRKLAKRRTRHLKQVKLFARYYKKVILIKK